MTPVIYTAPAVEPVLLADAQAHLRVTGQADEVTRLIKASRGVVERYLQRSLITQTWDVFYNNWCDELRLPFPPIQSVTHIKYYDTNGTLQTLPTNQYWLTKGDPGYIVKAYNTVWPQLQDGRPDRIVIRIVCGYGAAGTSVPEEIKQAMKLIMTDMYENKGTVSTIFGTSKIPNYVADLIHSYKIYDF